MTNNIPGFKRTLAMGVSNAFACIMEQAEPATADPAPAGTRLNHRAVFTHDYGSAFLQPSAVDGTRSILLIVDMSGSMSGMWSDGGGAEFVWGMIQFARQGGCNLRILLTGSLEGPAELPVSIPFKVFCSLYPGHGQESFARTMGHPVVSAMMEEADVTICWTDGQLTDGYVDAIRWRERNINVIGACLGDPKVRAYHPTKVLRLDEAMREYFHAAFIDDDSARIATRMASWIASSPLRSLR